MKAVDHVAHGKLFAGLQIHLLTVGADSPENRKRLDDAKATLEAGSHEATASIKSGQPGAVIARAVELDSIDLLVMGAYGHSRVRNLIIGSTATAMVRSCKIPIALVR